MKPEDISKILEDDKRRLDTASKVADQLVSEKTDAIRGKSQQLKIKLKKLIEGKYDLLHLPLTKAETLEQAREALKENRRLFFDEFLIEHLSNCQARQDIILSPRSVSGYFGPDKAWKLVYWILTEEDLKRAAEMLPNTGLSAAEKDAQIQKVDADIAAIEKELKKL